MYRPPHAPCPCDRKDAPPTAATAKPTRDCAPLAPPPPSNNPPPSQDRSPDSSDLVKVSRFHRVIQLVDYLTQIGLRLARIWDAIPEDVRDQLPNMFG